MSKIDRLTPEQEALLPVWRDRGLALGLSTTPLAEEEWERIERGTRECYRLAGLDQPRVVLRMDSPYSVALGQVFAHAMLAAVSDGQVWDQVGDQVWDQVGDQVRGRVRDQVRDQVGGQVAGQVRDQVGGQVADQVGDQVRGRVRDQVRDQVGGQVAGQVRDQVGGQVAGQVRGQVWGQVRDQVGGQVAGQVRGQVWGQVWGQVGAQVEGQVWNQVGAQVEGQVGAQVEGQVGGSLSYSGWDAGWLNWIRFWRETGIVTLKPETITLLDAWSDHAYAGISSWFPQVFAASDRPAFIHLDRQGNLHAENGQAIGWRDGWGFNAWHGTRLPDDFWEWDADKALAQPNAEHRRCWLEAHGWGPVLDKATLISDEPDVGNSDHRLKLYRLPDDVIDDDVLLLTMVNGSDNADGTRREYGELVDSRFTSALEASAAGYGLTADEYQLLEVRR